MKATKIFYNANVLTVDMGNSKASAVAIKDDIILKVGMDAEILTLADEKTEKIDLEQKTLIPGFYDSHGHFFYDSDMQASCVDLNSPPIAGCKNFEDCYTLLKEKIAQTPKGEWVQGFGFDDTMIEEKRFFTRHELDALTTEHPLIVRHISGHLGVLNSYALNLGGYDENTPDPEGGVIRREADGKTPDGVVEETAMIALMHVIPALDHEGLKKALHYNSYRLAQKGVTSSVECALGNPKHIKAMKELLAEDKFALRLVVSGFGARHDDLATVEEDKFLKVGGVKLLQDGSIQGYTAYLSKPYHTPHPTSGDPSWVGYPTYTPEELYKVMLEQHIKGRQIIIHTNGDQATEDVLNAFEKILGEHPRFDHRLLIVHAQVAREDQLDRFVKLGITPTFFTVHTYYWGDRHKALFLGSERAERQNPLRSALDRGLVCTSHCDAPITPTNPLLSMWTCVNRVSSTGQVIGKAQGITPTEALRIHTFTPAWQNFQENEKGSIEEGKLADFAVLDCDPTTCDPIHIKDIQVLATYLGGNCTYKK